MTNTINYLRRCADNRVLEASLTPEMCREIVQMCDGLAAERDAARAELERVRDGLEALQWCVQDSYTGEPGVYCPVCDRDKYGGHAPDCALSSALAAKGE